MTHAPNTPPPRPDNSGEPDYAACVAEIAHTLLDWNGPVVIATHTDPDGDALGSALALKRALDGLGKETLLPCTPPRYLDFLAEPGELSKALTALPEGALVAVLDVEVSGRLVGVPGHGYHRRRGGLDSCFRPSRDQQPRRRLGVCRTG